MLPNVHISAYEVHILGYSPHMRAYMLHICPHCTYAGIYMSLHKITGILKIHLRAFLYIFRFYKIFCFKKKFFNLRTIKKVGKGGIYIIYMVFCRAISNSIAPQPRHFFFVLGLRPRTKKILGFGAIFLHIALQNPIYTLHIYNIYIYIYYMSEPRNLPHPKP